MALEMKIEPRAVTVGEFEIVWLPDARGTFGTYDELFTGAPAGFWQRWRAEFPELFAGNAWMVYFGAFLVRGPRAVVLIDTGLGPPPGEEDFMYDRQGWLPHSLYSVGVARDEIDIVFSTHHHSDHIGWNVHDGTPFFPRARYVSGAEAWEWTLANRTEGFVTEQLIPLLEADVLDLIDDGEKIAPGMMAIATPGHYPGHMSVIVSSDDEQAVVLADVAVHPAQISNPDVTYAFDVHPDQASETRRGLFDRLRATNFVVLCSHYPRGGIGRLVDADGSLSWEPR